MRSSSTARHGSGFVRKWLEGFTRRRRARARNLSRRSDGIARRGDSLEDRALLTLTFQNGADNGYGTTNATDTYLNQDNDGDLIFGTSDQLRMDSGGTMDQALLQFESVFGNGPGQVPIGSTIHSATLTLTTGGSGSADGNGGSLHRMLVPWTSTDTWNDWGDGATFRNGSGGIQADDSEALATADLEITAFQALGRRSYDVTSSVTAWANGEAYHGWVIFGGGSPANRWEVYSSDFATVADRPELVIDFTPPEITTVIDVVQTRSIGTDEVPAAGDHLGEFVDRNETFTVVSSPQAEVAGTSRSGSVSIFHNETGELIRTIGNPTPNNDDALGPVALSGDLLVVGAPGEDSPGSNAGLAYVYEISTGNLLHTLTSPAAAVDNRFGHAVEFSGNVIAVTEIRGDQAAMDGGAVHLFDALTGNLLHSLVSTEPGADFEFGAGLAIDSGQVFVGSPGGTVSASKEGFFEVFDAATGAHLQTVDNPAAAVGDRFGVAIAVNNSLVAVTADHNDPTATTTGGELHTFARDTLAPLSHATAANEAANPLFGLDISLLNDNRVAVGVEFFSTDRSGAVLLYDGITGTLLKTIENPDPDSHDEFGSGVAAWENTLVIGARATDGNDVNSGAAYEYVVQVHDAHFPDVPDFNKFGSAVDMNDEFLVVGASDELVGGTYSGAVYVIDRATDEIVHHFVSPNPAGNDQFGAAVSVSDSHVVVGAENDDTGGAEAGATYVFDLATGNLLHTLLSPDASSADAFGRSVAIDDTTIVVGAAWEDNGADGAGSVYLFDALTGNHTQTINNPAPDLGDQFGTSVAIDAGVVVVGAPRDDRGGLTDSGSVWLFRADDNYAAVELVSLSRNSGHQFGSAVSISDGLIAVGEPKDSTAVTSGGSVHLFNALTADWVAQIINPDLHDNDEFGGAVDLSGNALLVGTQFGNQEFIASSGTAYLFDVSNLNLVATYNHPLPDPNDNFGVAVSVHDNHVLIGSHQDDTYATNSGAAFVHAFGSLGASLPTLSGLNGQNGFALHGIDTRDFLGFSVSSAGDVNGDGLDDFVIGADQADPAGDESGEAYVVFGQSSGFSPIFDLTTLDGTNGFLIEGIGPGDRLGRSVSAAGDINGDGYGDIILGADLADQSASNSGASYVIFGGNAFSSTFDLTDLDGSNGFRIDGDNADDRSGRSVSNAGDVNGDGFDDLILGAVTGDAGGTDSGESYVVFGMADGFAASLDVSSLDGTNGFRLDGESANSGSGLSVSHAGDVNGDGLGDIVIGSHEASPNGAQSGLSHVVFGTTAGFPSTISLGSLDGSNGFRIPGLAAGDHFGIEVDAAGDINGDGFDDLIFGTFPDDIAATTQPGGAFVLFGNSTFVANFDLTTLDGSNGFQIVGADEDRAGRSVSSAGDINGDGFDDLLIGSTFGGDRAGAVYVVYGNPTAFSPIVSLATLATDAGFRIDGIAFGDSFGISVSSAGDINGDGFHDMILAAEQSDTSSSQAGSTYVIFGGDFLAPADNSATGVFRVSGNGAAADTLIGGQGADILTSDGGPDVLRAGAEDDLLVIPDTDFSSTRVINGGLGNDTLQLSGSELEFDLTAIADNRISGIETIDLGVAQNNTLRLSPLEVFNLSNTTNTLTVQGSGGTVRLAGSGWGDPVEVSFSGTDFLQYSSGLAIVNVAAALATDVELASFYGEPGELLGRAVAVNEKHLVIGAELGNASGSQVGAVYVFDAVTHELRHTLNSPAGAISAGIFGYSTALSGDLIVVGDFFATHSGVTDVGVAHVFNANTGALVTTIANPRPDANDRFGIAVDISGNTVAVGAYFDGATASRGGAVYVFDATTGALLRTVENPAPAVDDFFGHHLAIDGDILVVGAYADNLAATDSGGAYVFDLSTTDPAIPLTPPSIATGDRFGLRVDVEGDRIVVAADKSDATATDGGVVHVFETDGTYLRQLDNPTPADFDGFGSSVNVSGGIVLVGDMTDDTNGTDTGRVYLFDTETGDLLRTFDSPSGLRDSFFGVGTARFGNQIVIGAKEDGTNGNLAGAAHVFSVKPDTLTLTANAELIAGEAGTLFATGAGASPTFTLVPGEGDTDNAEFDISGDKLVALFTVESKDEYSIRVRVTDEYGFFREQSFTFSTDDDATAPEVTLSPVNGTVFSSLENRALDWSATDASGIYRSDLILRRNGEIVFQTTQHSGCLDLRKFGVGDFTASLTVSDNDLDRVGDALSASVDSTFSVRDYTAFLPDAIIAAGDHYGSAVAMDDEYIVIGAPADEDATGVGAVFVYDRNSGALLHTLSDSEGQAFGTSVAVSNGLIAVGDPEFFDLVSLESGRVSVFDAATGASQFGIVPPSTVTGFGFSIDMDETYLVVGTPTHDEGASDTGGAFVYDRSGLLIRSLSYPLSAGDQFGYSVAVSGGSVVVGAPGDDSAGPDGGTAFVFNALDGTLTQSFQHPDAFPAANFGSSVDIDGSRAIVGANTDSETATNGGSAFVFDVSTGLVVSELVNPSPQTNDFFGEVSLSGNLATVGAPGDAVSPQTPDVSLFDATTGELLDTFTNPTGGLNSEFGGNTSVIHRNQILIPAATDATQGSDAGAAYLFTAGPNVLEMSPQEIVIGTSPGDIVSTLSTIGGYGDGRTFELVAGDGDEDNAAFSIADDSLVADTIFDLAVQDSYSVRLRVSDAYGLYFEQPFVLDVTTGSAFAPEIELPNSVFVMPGDFMDITGTFIDGDSTSWTATVDYGDGSGEQTLTLGLFEFLLNHQYETPGNFVATVTITDDSLHTTSRLMNVTVENDVPEPALYTFELTSPVNENSAVTLTGEFSDALSSGNYAALIDWGDESTTELNLASTERSFLTTHVYPDDSNVDDAPTATDIYEVSVTIAEIGGADVETPDSVLLAEVRNVVPHTLAANFSATDIVVGDSVELDLSFLDVGLLDSHVATIDWGDGTLDEISIAAGVQSATGISHSYLSRPLFGAEGYQVTVQVADDDEPLNPVELTQFITIGDSAPANVTIIDELGTGEINENGLFTIGGSFTDPGLSGAHQVTIDWGDGSGRNSFDLEEGVLSFSGVTHRYEDAPVEGNFYTITLSVADVDALDNPGTGTFDLIVRNVAPTISVPTLSSSVVNEGDSVVVTGTYSDASPTDTHSVSVTWGDGHVTPATVDSHSRTWTAEYVYGDNGPLPDFAYDLLVTVTDDDGSEGQAAGQLTVLNVAPDVSFLPAPGNTDPNYIFLQPDVFDPGTDDTLSYHWYATNGSETQEGFAPEFMLDRTGGAGHTVTLTVTDDDGGTGSLTLDIVTGSDATDTIILEESDVQTTSAGLLVVGLGGDDVIDASGITDPSISLVLDGGSGQDTLLGGAGDDVYILADGDDTANAGLGSIGIGGGGTTGMGNVQGDDRYILSPNSTLTIFDDDGGNILDFTRGGFGVTYDLSLLNSQTFVNQDVAPDSDPSQHFVNVQGVFTELVGSEFGDSLTAAADSTVLGGAGNDQLFVKDSTENVTIHAGADDDVLTTSGTAIVNLDFNGDDGADTLINTGIINGLNFGGGADDDVLQNSGEILGSLDFNGDDGLDILANAGDIASLTFGGGADDDIFINNGAHTTMLDFSGDDDILLNGAGVIAELDFGGDDGLDTFVNLGEITTLTFGGGADDDVFINNGTAITMLDFGGDDDTLLNGTGVITMLEFNGDDGLDTLQNLGTVGTLTFNGGADDDILQNDGSVITMLDFRGDAGLDMLLNTGDIAELEFSGGADDDIFLNNGTATTMLDFGGDDDILLNGTGSVGMLDFNGDTGGDIFINLSTITDLTFNGGADDDVLLNNGPATTSLDFGGDDDVLLNGTGTITNLDFNGDDGFDTLQNDGSVTTLTFGGGADDDVLINNGSDVSVLNFNGDDGADALWNNGSAVADLNFNGDAGLDSLINSGVVGTLTFEGGADDDNFHNTTGTITSLDFRGDEGIDSLVNDGSVTTLVFTGGADDDALLNNGTVVTSLDFNGDLGVDTLINDGDVTSLNFDGGADDDVLVNSSGTITNLDFNGDTGNDVFVNDANIADLNFSGGADDDILRNDGGVITYLDFHGDDGLDTLLNDGQVSSLVFTGGADDDSFLNRQNSVASVIFHGGGSDEFPLTDSQRDGDDLFVNLGDSISVLSFHGDTGNDVFENSGAHIQSLRVKGGADDDRMINTGTTVAEIDVDGDAGNDIFINTGDNIGVIDFRGDSSTDTTDSGDDKFLLRGSGNGTVDSTATFSGGNGTNAFRNFATGFHSIHFEGGEDSDVFINEASDISGLTFNALGGDNLFINFGDRVSHVSVVALDGNDEFANAGNFVADMILDAGSGANSIANAGDDVLRLDIISGDGSDVFSNRGARLTDSSFDGGNGDGRVLNTGQQLTNFHFVGGDSVDTLINRGDQTAGLVFDGFGGDDRMLNAGDQAANLTFYGGTGDDGFQNDGSDVSGILVEGHDGADVVIVNGTRVDNLTFAGGAGDDSFRNTAFGLTNSHIHGNDGDNVYTSVGDDLDDVTFSGGAGHDSLSLFGRILHVEFHSGEDEDHFENFATSTDSLVLSAGPGDDDIRNHGVVNLLTIDGGVGNDAFTNTSDVSQLEYSGGTGNDSFVNRGTITNLDADGGDGQDGISLSGSVLNATIDGGSGRSSIEVFSSGSEIEIVTAAERDSVFVTGEYETVVVQTGAGDDALLVSGSSEFRLTGGNGNDLYHLVGNALVDVVIDEPYMGEDDVSSDTLDFSAFTSGAIDLELTSEDSQLFAGLALTLTDGLGIENVIGTAFSDLIIGNARDNYLAGADLTVPFIGQTAERRDFTQWVLLDYDTYTESGEHQYSTEERAAILARLSDIYHGPDPDEPWFDIQFTEDVTRIPVSADEYITVQINDTPPSGRPGGLASEIDPGNRNPGGSAIVQISGMLGGIVSEVDAIAEHDHANDYDHADDHSDEATTEEPIATDVVGSLKPIATTENYVALTSKVVAHEVGHLLGLRHQDAFGPIGFGPNISLGGTGFNPDYPGPVSAFETYDHISGSPASIGTTRFNDLNDLFFGEREAIKLTAATSNPDVVNSAEQMDDHQSITTAQPLQPALLSVPNTLSYGMNAGDSFSVLYASVRAQIEIDAATEVSENDYYSLTGSAGDIVTIEVMSNSVNAFGAEPDDFIDSLLRVYDEHGELLPYFGSVAENDDIFEPTDSALFDLTLPYDGTFYIEVDTFRRDPDDPLGDPSHPNSPLNPDNPNNILDHPDLVKRFTDTLADSDVGQYELIVYNFRDTTATDGQNYIQGNGGNDEILGATALDILPPESRVVALPQEAESLQFPIEVDFADAEDGINPSSGVQSIDVFVAVDRGTFSLWRTLSADAPLADFTAESGHTYWFRSVATDVAGNVEDEAVVPDTHIIVGDLDPPDTSILTGSFADSGVFQLEAHGADSGGGALASIQFFVQIDGEPAQLIGSTGAAQDGSGSLSWQGLVDNLPHTYEFYSVGIDSNDNVETAPALADYEATATFSEMELAATTLDVQQGANQRSFVRYIDVGFNDTVGVGDIVQDSANRIRIERFALSETTPDIGTGTLISVPSPVADGNLLTFDFGAGGIGGNGRSIAGNGFYRISIDTNGDGLFNDQHFEFARILGDADGNGAVDPADLSVVLAQYGQSGSNLDGDITGDGYVNVLDRIFTMRNYGAAFNEDLLQYLDD